MGKIKISYIILNTLNYQTWEREIRAGFEADDDIKYLNQIIQDAKTHLLHQGEEEEAADKTPYRNLKIRRQLRWLNYYENELVKKLEVGFNDARRHHPADLYVVVMPEVLIRDDNYENKHPYSHYVNPLYEDVVKAFLGTDGTRRMDGSVEMLGREAQSRTLLSFTLSNPDVIIFAGTIWWKQLHRDYPKGILFNSAPVFYKNKCCFLWDKQFLAGADGVPSGKLFDQWIKYRIDYMPMPEAVMTTDYPKSIRSMEDCIQNYYGSDSWPKVGIISNLTKLLNPYANPLLAIALPNQETLVFGIDICMDDYYEENKALSQHFFEQNVPIRIISSNINEEPLMAENIDSPHIQIIVANSFGTHGNYFSRGTVCLCDLELSIRSKVLTPNPLNQSFNPCTLTEYSDHFFLMSQPLELELSI